MTPPTVRPLFLPNDFGIYFFCVLCVLFHPSVDDSIRVYKSIWKVANKRWARTKILSVRPYYQQPKNRAEVIRRKFKKEGPTGSQRVTRHTVPGLWTVVPLFFFCSSKQLGYYTFLTGLRVSVFSIEKFYDKNRNSILLIGYRDVRVRHNSNYFCWYKVTLSSPIS